MWGDGEKGKEKGGSEGDESHIFLLLFEEGGVALLSPSSRHHTYDNVPPHLQTYSRLCILDLFPAYLPLSVLKHSPE